jgi:hypothetical protein
MPAPVARRETVAMSYPQPAAPNWFTRLSPLRRLGVIFGTTLVLCLLGAAGFVALLPADARPGHQPASPDEPAPAGAVAGPAAVLPDSTAAVAGAGPAAVDPVLPGATATAAPRLGPRPTTGDKPLTDPRFGTCQQARQHHYGPYRRGDTEYGWYPDADDDGLVCE